MIKRFIFNKINKIIEFARVDHSASFSWRGFILYKVNGTLMSSVGMVILMKYQA